MKSRLLHTSRAAVFLVASLLPARGPLHAGTQGQAQAQPPTPTQGFTWWREESVQRKLSLNGDQVQRIEDVFQSARPELRRTKRQLDEAEGDLSRVADTSAGDAALAQQVDRVEAARSALNKARTLMLLRIRRILTTDQRVKIDALHKEREREHAGRDTRH